MLWLATFELADKVVEKMKDKTNQSFEEEFWICKDIADTYIILARAYKVVGDADQANKAIQKASSLYYWLKDNADAHGLDERFYIRLGINSLIKAESYIGDIDKANWDIKHLVAHDHIYRDISREFFKVGYCCNKHWMDFF